MGTELKFIQNLHNSTKREYLKRMVNNKVLCSKKARKFGFNYWDGDRKYGYGGYKYIKDRWKPLAIKLIKRYQLTSNSKVLDLGCGKGYLLYEIKKLLPKIKIVGLDISKYAIKNSHEDIKNNLHVYDIRKKLKFQKKEFDLLLSLGTLHNFHLDEIIKAIDEIARVSKKSYIMVESFKNVNELFNLQCWALTCNTFINSNSWVSLIKKFNSIDYEFIYFR